MIIGNECNRDCFGPTPKPYPHSEVGKSGNALKNAPLFMALPTDLVTPITVLQRLALHSIRKGSSLCPNPFKGFTLRSESFKGMKGVGGSKMVNIHVHAFYSYFMFIILSFVA